MCVHRRKSFQVRNGKSQMDRTKRDLKTKVIRSPGLDFNIDTELKRRRPEGKMKVLRAHQP